MNASKRIRYHNLSTMLTVLMVLEISRRNSHRNPERPFIRKKKVADILNLPLVTPSHLPPPLFIQGNVNFLASIQQHGLQFVQLLLVLKLYPLSLPLLSPFSSIVLFIIIFVDVFDDMEENLSDAAAVDDVQSRFNGLRAVCNLTPYRNVPSVMYPASGMAL